MVIPRWVRLSVLPALGTLLSAVLAQAARDVPAEWAPYVILVAGAVGTIQTLAHPFLGKKNPYIPKDHEAR